MQSINSLIQQRKETRLAEPHNDVVPNVSTIYAKHSTNPTDELSFAITATDTDEPKNAPAATQEPLNHIRQKRSPEVNRSVAAEIVHQSKMPQYPGLERWILVEKMGDGAFSNVYRARDSKMEFGEVAIKVLRSFQMNSNQVDFTHSSLSHGFGCMFESANKPLPLALIIELQSVFWRKEVAKVPECARTPLGCTRLTSYGRLMTRAAFLQPHTITQSSFINHLFDISAPIFSTRSR
jgi:hypothetical protein